jgi:uncharacterized membrane protein YdjX (TVP38/TMEM64 family)
MTEGRDGTQGEMRGTASLLGQILERLSALLRKEVLLARQETAEKLRRARGAVVWLASAVMMALVALNLFAAAAVLAIAEAVDLGLAWSALAVGAPVAVVALLGLAKGIGDLKPENLVPERTARSPVRSATIIKESLND